MNYNGGVAVDTGKDVLDQIASVAAGAGWTILNHGVDLGGGSPTTEAYRSYVVILSNGDHEFGISFNNATSGGTIVSPRGFTYSYNDTLPLTSQGAHIYGDYIYCSGAICHVFASAAAVYVVVETAANSCRHFSFGGLTKNDAYDGGAFITTQDSYPSTYTPYHGFPFAKRSNVNYTGTTLGVTVAGDGYSRRWRYNSTSHAFPDLVYGGLSHSSYDVSGMTQQLVDACANQFNRQSILFPIHCFVARAGGGDFSPIGYPPDIRALNIRYLSNGETVNLGNDTWKTFPIGDRNSSDNGFTSLNTGIAYLVT